MPTKKTTRTKASAKAKTPIKAKAVAAKVKKKPVAVTKKATKAKTVQPTRKPATAKKAARPTPKVTKSVKPKAKAAVTKSVKPVKKAVVAKVAKKAAAPMRAKAKPVPVKAAAPRPRPVSKPILKIVKKSPAPMTNKKTPPVSMPSFNQMATAHLGTMGVPPYQEKAGEEYMNVEQRKHFRHILNLWKQDLMEEVDRTVHHMQDEAANFPDPNDRASQEEEFSLELRARDRERKLIKKIHEALQRMEQDDYGYCDACGIEIGIRRLEARPTATLCIDCKTLDEIKERQMGGVNVE